jgi:hypothetical protein
MALNWEALRYLELPPQAYAVVGPAVMEAYGWLPADTTEILVTDALYYSLADMSASHYRAHPTGAECQEIDTPHGAVIVSSAATYKAISTFPGTTTVIDSSSDIDGVAIAHPGLIRAWQGAPGTPPANSFVHRPLH